jgi:PhnB protein
MQLNAYLEFDGQCGAAFKFYQRCLGGEIVAMMTFGETVARDHVPAEFHDKIMHARLQVGDQVLMGSDTTPEHPYEGVKGASVALNVATPEEAERTFDALSASGNVVMPLQQTFWAARFGMFVDQFGVPWMINCEQGTHA